MSVVSYDVWDFTSSIKQKCYIVIMEAKKYFQTAGMQELSEFAFIFVIVIMQCNIILLLNTLNTNDTLVTLKPCFNISCIVALSKVR